MKVSLSEVEHVQLRVAAAEQGMSMVEFCTGLVRGSLCEPVMLTNGRQKHLTDTESAAEILVEHPEVSVVDGGRLHPTPDDLRAETDRIVAAARVKKAEGCDHKWVNGASGMTVCSKCGGKK